jgi:cobalamin biosynthesis protein CbiD
MFASKRNVRLAVTAAAIAAAAFMNSCGGKKVSATQVAASGGFETVTTPATELEDIKRDMEAKSIPCGIGIGESTDEQVARNVSSDEARTEVAKSIDVHVQRLSESYAQNVGNEAKKIWEEAVRQITDQHVKGAKIFKTIVQYNKDNSHYKIYSLIVLDPSLFKAAVSEAMARDEEFELRVKKDEMMSKLDANIAEYESKYRR